MKNPCFRSNFANEFLLFLEHRRKRGLKDTSSFIAVLRRLDEFIAKNCKDKIFSRENADLWIQKDQSESPSGHYKRINTSKLFFQFLYIQGYNVFLFDNIRHPSRTFTPHIYTDQEITNYFSAVDNYDSISNPFQKLQLPILFRILYCCGTRISETLFIRKKDVDLANGIILLSETKNCKQRFIVLSDQLIQLMKSFAEKTFYLLKDNDYIFHQRDGARLSKDSVYDLHRKFLQKAGIPYIGEQKGPRIHDWRHTFAVKSFKKMSDDGIDMYVALPILSTYLGHATIMATEYYLRLSMELYPHIKERMERSFEKTFQEREDGKNH